MDSAGGDFSGTNSHLPPLLPYPTLDLYPRFRGQGLTDSALPDEDT